MAVTCEQVSCNYSAFYEEELGSAESVVLKKHIASCAACKQSWQSFLDHRQELLELERREVPAEFTASVIDLIGREMAADQAQAELANSAAGNISSDVASRVEAGLNQQASTRSVGNPPRAASAWWLPLSAAASFCWVSASSSKAVDSSTSTLFS